MHEQERRQTYTIGWGALWAVVLLVLGYLIMPLSTRVDHNSTSIHALDIRMTKSETEVSLGFKTMSNRFDRLEEMLKRQP
jgi:hypothetical protein